MNSFHEFVQAKSHITTDELRQDIILLANKLSHMQPPDVEDLKETLLQLREILDDKLTGA